MLEDLPILRALAKAVIKAIDGVLSAPIVVKPYAKR